MKITSYLYILTAIIIWAGALPIIKLVLNDTNPFLFLILRFALVCLVCLPLLYIFLTKRKYNLFDWIHILIFALGSQVSLIFLFLGIELTTSSDAIIISMFGPILTIAGGHFFFREKYNLIKEIGILIAIIGSFLVVVEPIFSSTNGTIPQRVLGNALVALHAILNTFWVFHSKLIFGKTQNVFTQIFSKIKKKFQLHTYNEIELNVLSFYIAFIAFLPFYFFNFDNYNTQIFEISGISYLGIVYMAVLSSIVAYICFSKGQAKLKVSEVSILSYSTPLFSLPLSYLILGEIPTAISLIGLGVIFSGIFLTFKKG